MEDIPSALVSQQNPPILGFGTAQSEFFLSFCVKNLNVLFAWVEISLFDLLFFLDCSLRLVRWWFEILEIKTNHYLMAEANAKMVGIVGETFRAEKDVLNLSCASVA